MSRVENFCRRSTPKDLRFAGLLLGANVAGYSSIRQAAATDVDASPNLFVSISPLGEIAVVTARSEMGAGIRTSLAMILADELDADWHLVRVRQARGVAVYDGRADGSKNTRSLLATMRKVGATARHMLVVAAARRWNVDASACHTENSAVILRGSGKQLPYGALVGEAATLQVPSPQELMMKARAVYRYIGTPPSTVETGGIVRGVDVVLLRQMNYPWRERPPS